MTNAQHRTAPGLLLHLAGPLQSWGERSHYNERDTARFPTRSGVLGLLAAALGRPRDQDPADLATLSVTVRTDRPGVLLRDLHTVGGGQPAKGTVTTAEGKKRPTAAATLLSHRYYLADAAFTVAVTGADPELLIRAAGALREPAWPPYLGRRSCPAEGPLLIGLLDDPMRQLVQLPLAAQAPRTPDAVLFHGDHPLDRLPAPDDADGALPHDAGTAPVGEVTDDPVSYHPRHRAHRARPLYRRAISLPTDQYAGLGTAYLNALAKHLDEHTPQPQGSLA